MWIFNVPKIWIWWFLTTFLQKFESSCIESKKSWTKRNFANVWWWIWILEKQNNATFAKKYLWIKEFNIQRVRYYCYLIESYGGTANRTCNLKKVVLLTILMVMHNGSIYDYHFKAIILSVLE